MKKKLWLVTLTVLCAALLFTSMPVFAEETTAENDEIKVELDGVLLTFDVEPLIDDGRTMVPFRAIFEKLGCEVGYEQDTTGQHISAKKEGYDLAFDIGSDKMKVNEKECTLDVGPKIVNSRTLVPLRAVSEALDCNVGWNGDVRTVYIQTKGNYVKPEEPILNSRSEIGDGIYNVALDPNSIKEENGTKTISVQFYLYDTYDIVDIGQLKVGDMIEYCGNAIYIKDLKHDGVEDENSSIVSTIDINGGFGASDTGITLCAEADTNGWRTLTTDDYPAYYTFGTPQTMQISDKLVLTDAFGGDPDATPVKVEYKDFETYMKEHSPDAWHQLCTTIRTEGQKIVEINRRWIP